MSETPPIVADLEALQRKWEELTAIPESPRSLMSVIEYSLGSQKKAEVYVNRLLRYFLDPEEPHGMEAEFLKAFLEGLPPGCGFQEDIYDLSSIQVDDQVRIHQLEDGETQSTGRVDLCIEVPNEWFLLIELKFSAKDTQTEFYYEDATHIEDRPKSEYESGEYYLYLHQANQPTANASGFTNWTWQEATTDVIEPFLVDNGPRYPQRTVTQLRELIDDLEHITGMTDHQQMDQEKIELYLDHYDAITDVTDTFDDRWAAFTDEWSTQLGAALEDEGLGTASQFDEDVVAVSLNPQASDESDWRFRSSSDDWGMIFKHGWWRHTDDLQTILHARPDDRNDVRIGFHHRLDRNRDLVLGDHTLKIYFRNMGANDQPFIDTFSDLCSARSDDIADRLPDVAELTGNKLDMTVASYDIRPSEHDDFFEAYVAALNQAFIDHVIEGDALITLIDELYRDAIEEVYGVSLDPV